MLDYMLTSDPNEVSVPDSGVLGKLVDEFAPDKRLGLLAIDPAWRDECDFWLKALYY